MEPEAVIMRRRWKMILKLFFQRQRINDTPEKPDDALNWRHGWITHIGEHSTTRREVEIAVVRWYYLLTHKLHGTTSFTCTNQIQSDLRNYDYWPFSNSSKWLLLTSSQAPAKLKQLSIYLSVMWCTQKHGLEDCELLISYMTNVWWVSINLSLKHVAGT